MTLAGPLICVFFYRGGGPNLGSSVPNWVATAPLALEQWDLNYVTSLTPIRLSYSLIQSSPAAKKGQGRNRAGERYDVTFEKEITISADEEHQIDR